MTQPEVAAPETTWRSTCGCGSVVTIVCPEEVVRRHWICAICSAPMSWEPLGLRVTAVRREPCSACPYRRDAPSGVWAADEYLKLPPYDGETWEQPTAAFGCHATPDHYCHGWALTGTDDLLALRLDAARAGAPIDLPDPFVALWATHSEAAEHGLAGIAEPGPAAAAAIERLLRKHPRLRGAD